MVETNVLGDLEQNVAEMTFCELQLFCLFKVCKSYCYKNIKLFLPQL